MEFRILVVVLPMAVVLVTLMLSRLQPRIASAALIASLLVCSVFHGLLYFEEYEVDSVRLLNAYVADPDQGWIMTGRKLGEILGSSATRVTIATTAAGAIPYYSGLPTLDMHGLSDPWIARHGVVRESTKPGHQRIAPLEYALRLKVNLVLGHPHIVARSADLPRYRIEDFLPRAGPGTAIPAGARLVEVPLNDRYRIIMLYLVPSPEIDRIFREKGFRTWDVAPS